jgi:hypothetical protein
VRAALAAAALVALVSVAPAPAAPPPGLTERGRMLWHFEALLRDTYGNGPICSERPQSFVSGSCSPLAVYRPYFYVFADARGSAFQRARRAVASLGPVGRSSWIRIGGRTVACNRARDRFPDRLCVLGGAVGRLRGAAAVTP